MQAPGPNEAFASFECEVDLLLSAGRTGAPAQDAKSGFFGLPHDDFLDVLRNLRDEIEQRAYFAIVAAAEGVIQIDFRARANGRANVPLRSKARDLTRKERHRRRIVLEDVLDAWSDLPGARREPISEFKQLLNHRHWLAHGRYFVNRAGVPDDPSFAMARATALFDELHRVDPAFPRGDP
jgi:hypothetical protein